MKTNVTFDNIRDEFVHHAAMAFFASAYADMADEAGQSLSGEIMDQLPNEIDIAAMHAANTLAMQIENSNKWEIEVLFAHIASEGNGDRPNTVEYFGHYAAMQAMGHGVGLGDAFGAKVEKFINVPYIEFGAYSLAKDYF